MPTLHPTPLSRPTTSRVQSSIHQPQTHHNPTSPSTSPITCPPPPPAIITPLVVPSPCLTPKWRNRPHALLMMLSRCTSLFPTIADQRPCAIYHDTVVFLLLMLGSPPPWLGQVARRLIDRRLLGYALYKGSPPTPLACISSLFSMVAAIIVSSFVSTCDTISTLCCCSSLARSVSAS